MRCVICDRSDVGSEYRLGKSHSNSFYPDPKATEAGGHLCLHCAESFIETMHDFYLDDLDDPEDTEE